LIAPVLIAAACFALIPPHTRQGTPEGAQLKADPIIVGQQVRDMLGRLHDLYGRDQPLLSILDRLNARLSQARPLYGPKRSIPAVVSGLYEKLDELRKLYGYDSIEENTRPHD